MVSDLFYSTNLHKFYNNQNDYIIFIYNIDSTIFFNENLNLYIRVTYTYKI